MTTAKPSVAEIVTTTILEALEKGTAPWSKPWIGKGTATAMSVDGKVYTGFNRFLLNWTRAANGHTSPVWGTYKAWEKKGAQVRKGEKSATVCFFKVTESKETYATRQEAQDAAKRWESPKKLPSGRYVLVSFMLRYYRVFNESQVEGGKLPKRVEAHKAKEAQEAPNGADSHALADSIMTDYITAQEGLTLHHGHDGAAYVPALDQIHMPDMDAFKSTEGYYSTLFHEGGHSTGAKGRLGRKGVVDFDKFGSEQYSQEELVAEMTAAMLCGVVGLDNDDQSAAYVKGWLSHLKDDPAQVVYAAQQAEKAAALILGDRASLLEG